MKIFNFTLPDLNINNETELFYRSDKPCLQENNSLYIKKNTNISFDAYFNIFSLDKYNKYSVIKELSVCLNISGRAKIKLTVKPDNSDEKEYTVTETETNEASNSYEITIDDISKHPGMLYLSIEALSDCVFYSAAYETDAPASGVNVAAVICTYRRESFVYSNMERIAEFDFNGDLRIFIIDNGKTIDKNMIKSDIVTVFKNKNYGGSGGFTRGLIEAYRRRNDITHVLLMDDDIAFDCNVLLKTITFLKLLKPECKNLWISGSMLVSDEPYMLYESGAKFKDIKITCLNNGLDLRKSENVFLNEKSAEIDYGAWWYICMPVNIIERQGLPVPFFIKGDDMEYGIRSDDEIITLNGVAVLHERFEYKYNFTVDYYSIRNILILNMMKGESFLNFYRMLFFTTGKTLLSYRYAHYPLIYRAYIDFFKGIDFLKTTDEEKLNADIRAMAVPLEDYKTLSEKYNIDFCKTKNLNKPNISRILQILTLNGYLIPKFLLHKDYIVLDLINSKPWEYYKYKTIVQVNGHEKKGIYTTIKKLKIFSVGFGFLKLAVISVFRYNKAKSYRIRKDELTSMAFWCGRLGIPNPGNEENINE